MVLYFTSAQFQSKHVCCVPLNHKTEYVHDLVQPQTYSVLSCSIWITEFCLSCCVFYFVITTPFLPSWQVKMQQIFLLFTKRNYCSKYFICCSKLPASENKLVPLFTVAFKTDRSGCKQFMLSSSLQETSVCYFISKVCSSGQSSKKGKLAINRLVSNISQESTDSTQYSKLHLFTDLCFGIT